MYSDAAGYLHDSCDVFPILLISSPEKRCGKTTLIRTLQRLCHRPMTASNITPAALFRFIESHGPTLLIDEADSFATGNEELRGIVNSGHTKDTAFVIRCSGESHDARRFTTWCPKALAGIGSMPATIEDRSIKLVLQRKKPGESVEKLPKSDDWQEYRRKAARWAADNRAVFAASRHTLPNYLQNRAADNWAPLFGLAMTAGGEWPQRVERAALSMAAEHDSSSISEMLLRDIRTCFDAAGRDKLSSDELTKLLVSHGEPLWAAYDLVGGAITQKQLAGLLRPYRIESKSVRLPDGRTPKGYDRPQFEDAFARYLPPPAATPPQPNNDGPSSGELKRHMVEDSRHGAATDTASRGGGVAGGDGPQSPADPGLWRCGASAPPDQGGDAGTGGAGNK